MIWGKCMWLLVNILNRLVRVTVEWYHMISSLIVGWCGSSSWVIGCLSVLVALMALYKTIRLITVVTRLDVQIHWDVCRTRSSSLLTITQPSTTLSRHNNHSLTCFTLPVESASSIPWTSFCSLSWLAGDHGSVILHLSPHHSPCLHSCHLSFPQSVTPDLKPICSTNPFLHKVHSLLVLSELPL